MKKVDITEELTGTLLEGRPILARGTVKNGLSVTSLLLTRTDTGASVLEERELVIAVEMPDGVIETVPVVRASSVATGWLVTLASPLPDTVITGSPWVIATSNKQLGAVPRAPDEKVLMSAVNPTGWKLEDLVKTLITEVEAKTARIAADTRPIALHVLGNNVAIVAHLKSVLETQEASIKALAGFKADQGPEGTPRIGEGSGFEPTDPVDDLKQSDTAAAHVDGAAKPAPVPSVPENVRAAQAETEAKSAQGQTNEPIVPLPPVTGPGTASVENNAGPSALHGSSADAFAGQAVTETGSERASATRAAPEKKPEEPLAYQPTPGDAATGEGVEPHAFRGKVDLTPTENPDHGAG